jgi:uncharacterized protein DUF998
MAKGSLVASTILLTIFALVWIVVGLFTAAPPTRAVHTTASVVGELAAIAALIIIGVGSRRSPTWRAGSLSAIIAGAVALVLVLLTFKTSQRSIPASDRLGGLMERLLVIELLLWFVAFGWKLVRTGNRTAANP